MELMCFVVKEIKVHHCTDEIDQLEVLHQCAFTGYTSFEANVCVKCFIP